MKEYKLFIDCDDVLVPTRDAIQSGIDLVTDKYPEEIIVRANQSINSGMQTLEFLNDSRSLNAMKLVRYIRKKIRDEMMTFDQIQDEINALKKLDFEGLPANYEKTQNSYSSAIDLICLGILLRERYLEERDHFMELNNPLPDGAIDYDKMYQPSNLNPGAEKMIRDAVSGDFDEVSVITHHNRGRELEAKKRLIEDVLNVKLIAPRFHKMDYVAGFRRPRQSKADYVRIHCGIPDLSSSILIDDSMDNLDTWITAGGIAILYDPKQKYKSNDQYLVIHDLSMKSILTELRSMTENLPRVKKK